MLAICIADYFAARQKLMSCPAPLWAAIAAVGERSLVQDGGMGEIIESLPWLLRSSEAVLPHKGLLWARREAITSSGR